MQPPAQGFNIRARGKPSESGLAVAYRAGSVQSLVFSPDGTILASGGGDHVIHLWDMRQNPPSSRTLQ